MVPAALSSRLVVPPARSLIDVTEHLGSTRLLARQDCDEVGEATAAARGGAAEIIA